MVAAWLLSVTGRILLEMSDPSYEINVGDNELTESSVIGAGRQIFSNMTGFQAGIKRLQTTFRIRFYNCQPFPLNSYPRKLPWKKMWAEEEAYPNFQHEGNPGAKTKAPRCAENSVELWPTPPIEFLSAQKIYGRNWARGSAYQNFQHDGNPGAKTKEPGCA